MKKQKLIISIVIILFALTIGAFFVTNNDEKNVDKAANKNTSTETIVYETEVDSPDECSSYEEYSPTSKTCNFECEDELECDEILNAIDEELASYLDEYTNGIQNTESSDASTDANIKAKYSVGEDEKINLLSGSEDPDDIKIWNQIKAISPNNLSNKYIETFEVFDNPEDNTLAFVVDGDGNGKFDIAINISQHKLSTTKEQTLTIIHELGHIVTLNMDEISGDSCSGYKTQEGCFDDNSILGAFVKQYWSKEQIDKSKNNEVVFNKNNFVTQYAATSPEEDIAESFAFYVVNNMIESTNLASQKQAFFDQFNNVVEIKKSMRQSIAKGVVLKRKL